MNSDGVKQDYVEAEKWIRLAAEAWNALAQFNLGLMYIKGDGVSQDYCHAYMWFKLASAQLMAKGDENASENALKGYTIAASKMSPEQIAEAEEMAKDMLLQSMKNQKKP